jgi:hypothetical protein
MRDSHDGEDVNCGLLECDAVWLPTFRRTVSPPSSGYYVLRSRELVKGQKIQESVAVLIRLSDGGHW